MSIRYISISKRMLLQLGTVIVGLILLLGVSLSQINQALLNSKTENTRMLVESAHSIIEHHYRELQAGKTNEGQAKNNAIQQIMTLRYDNGNYFWVNDMHPKMIAHATKPSLNGQDISGIKDPNGKALFVDMTEPGQEAPADKISYVKGFEPWGWIIGSGVYIDDVRTSFMQFAILLAAIGSAIVVAVGLLSFYVNTSIQSPLRAVVDALRDIASGQGDLTKTLPVSGSDELTLLSRHFNQFTQKIREILLNVRESTSKLNESTEELSQTFSESQSAIEGQRQESASIRSSMTEMLAASKSIANNAEQSTTYVVHAESEAKSGDKVVRQTASMVRALTTDIENTESIILGVAESSQDISKILEVIRGIADQTNLLALNAAIEAARAGEQGRGVAVVADEVRALASKTQNATEEIRQMIETLVSGSEKAVSAMVQGKSSATKSLDAAKSGVQALSSISNEMKNISGTIAQTANAAEAQDQVSKEINNSVKRIIETVEGTCQSFENSSTAERKLIKLGQELDTLIQAFKL